MSEIFDAEKIQKKFGKLLAEAQLETCFDKFIIIGYDKDEGPEVLSNCTEEQVGLLIQIFHQQYGFAKPSTES